MIFSKTYNGIKKILGLASSKKILNEPVKVKIINQVNICPGVSVPVEKMVNYCIFATFALSAVDALYTNSKSTSVEYCGVACPEFDRNAKTNPYLLQYFQDERDKLYGGKSSTKVRWEFFLPTKLLNTDRFLYDCAKKLYSDFPSEDQAKNQYYLRTTYNNFMSYNKLVPTRVVRYGLTASYIFVVMPVVRDACTIMLMKRYALTPNVLTNVAFLVVVISVGITASQVTKKSVEIIFYTLSQILSLLRNRVKVLEEFFEKDKEQSPPILIE